MEARLRLIGGRFEALSEGLKMLLCEAFYLIPLQKRVSASNRR